MAIFKCKACGASLEVNPGDKIVTCDYCNSTQTVPDADDEKKIKLYNRANLYRFRSDFDRSIVAYQEIIAEFPDDAEARWGLCLSKYGIEYVDDPRTGEKVPTCHRTLFESILEDPDYLDAVRLADVVARDLYIAEAKEIDRIQKRIIKISQKEDPYDIFICYKETDNIGRRTSDSVIAQDIYDKLTEKGYNVFFARITLENKLGLEYEPIIFAALRSAKIMLVVGTKAEYFEAVWVKNEWSRFLSFMRDSENKYLIPCYKDIDAYEMPDEFLPLQSQDMGKVGCLQDLCRGIDKIFGKDKKKVVVQTAAPGSNLDAIFRRIELNLAASEFEKADVNLEHVFVIDEFNARAYFYKFMIENRITKAFALKKTTYDLMGDPNFEIAYKNADPEFKKELDEYINYQVYNKAKQEYNKRNFEEALKIFSTIVGFLDVNEKIEEIKEKVLSDKYFEAKEKISEHEYDEALKILETIIDYRDSKQLIEEISETAKEYYLERGKYYFDQFLYLDALAYFKKVSPLELSYQYIQDCYLNLADQCIEDEKYDDAIKWYQHLDDQLLANEKISEMEIKKEFRFKQKELHLQARKLHGEIKKDEGELADAVSQLNEANRSIQKARTTRKFQNITKIFSGLNFLLIIVSIVLYAIASAQEYDYYSDSPLTNPFLIFLLILATITSIMGLIFSLAGVKGNALKALGAIGAINLFATEIFCIIFMFNGNFDELLYIFLIAVMALASSSEIPVIVFASILAKRGDSFIAPYNAKCKSLEKIKASKSLEINTKKEQLKVLMDENSIYFENFTFEETPIVKGIKTEQNKTGTVKQSTYTRSYSVAPKVLSCISGGIMIFVSVIAFFISCAMLTFNPFSIMYGFLFFVVTGVGIATIRMKNPSLAIANAVICGIIALIGLFSSLNNPIAMPLLVFNVIFCIVCLILGLIGKRKDVNF